MSKKLRLDRKIVFQNTFYTKCINVMILKYSIGPSINLDNAKSIQYSYPCVLKDVVLINNQQ